MPFQATCPCCPARFRLSEERAGASVRCPKCGNYFTAAPEDALPRPVTPRQQASETASVDTAIAAPQEPIQFREPVFALPPISLGISVWTALALLLAALGLAAPFVAARYVPLAFAGSLALPLAGTAIFLCGLAYLFRPPDGSDRPWLFGAGLLSAIALVAPIVAPRPALPGPRQLLEAPAPGDFIIVTRDNRQVVQTLGVSQWAAAEREGLRQGGVHVHLASIRVAPPPWKKGIARPPLPPALLIHVQVASESRPFQYQSLRGLAGVRLVDDAGKTYPLRADPTLVDAADQLDRDLLTDGPVHELLIFEPPASSVSELKLQLPALAWGGTGFARFRVPCQEPIEPLPAPKPAPQSGQGSGAGG